MKVNVSLRSRTSFFIWRSLRLTISNDIPAQSMYMVSCRILVCAYASPFCLALSPFLSFLASTRYNLFQVCFQPPAFEMYLLTAFFPLPDKRLNPVSLFSMCYFYFWWKLPLMPSNSEQIWPQQHRHIIQYWASLVNAGKVWFQRFSFLSPGCVHYAVYRIQWCMMMKTLWLFIGWGNCHYKDESHDKEASI